MGRQENLFQTLKVPGKCVREGDVVSVDIYTQSLRGDRYFVYYDESVLLSDGMLRERRRKEKFMNYDAAVVGFHHGCRVVACQFMITMFGGDQREWQLGIDGIGFWTGIVRSGRAAHEYDIGAVLKLFHQLPELGGKQRPLIRAYLKQHRAEFKRERLIYG